MFRHVAARLAVVEIVNGRPNVFDVGRNGVADHNHLEAWNQENHDPHSRVSKDLNEFLDQHVFDAFEHLLLLKFCKMWIGIVEMGVLGWHAATQDGAIMLIFPKFVSRQQIRDSFLHNSVPNAKCGIHSGNSRPVAILGHLARFRESDYHHGCFCSRARQSLISCGSTFRIRSGNRLFSEWYFVFTTPYSATSYAQSFCWAIKIGL
jgi:hypothetical protein